MTADVSSPHILAINDDQSILDLFRELLEEEGYRVSTRREHDKDLTSLKTLAPDLVILDYMWAADDAGWSFLELLKLDPDTAAIPIILCTGALEQVEALEPHLAAMDVRVVLKPFDLDQLLGVIRDALDQPTGAG